MRQSLCGFNAFSANGSPKPVETCIYFFFNLALPRRPLCCQPMPLHCSPSCGVHLSYVYRFIPVADKQRAVWRRSQGDDESRDVRLRSRAVIDRLESGWHQLLKS